MSASMLEGQRKQAMESLKAACQRFIDCEAALPSVLNDRERKHVERARRKARDRIVDCWERFPECYGDGQAGAVPSAKEILAIIERQETAIALPAADRTFGTWRTVHPKGGDPAEWPEDLRVREFPNVRN